MDISFSVEAVALNRAIGVVSIVTPQPQTGGGYLFMVRRETCDVYSRDGKHEARASFPVSDVEGEGAFILPAEAVSGLSYISGEMKFHATEKDGVFKVKYNFGESGLVDQVSFDPRAMHIFERDISAARESVAPKEFSIKLLQFALATTKPFLPKASDVVDQDVYRTWRVFGNSTDPNLARANGIVQASNGKEACYFNCSGPFADKDLSLPTQHLSFIEAFLARSSGSVSIYQTETKLYMINAAGDVLGWPRHSVEYKRFHYPSEDADAIVVKVSPDEIIPRLKMMRANLPKDKPSKVRMHFNPSTNTISFSSVDESKRLNSDPVSTEKVEVKITEPRTMNVNVVQMLHMFEGIRGDKVEFRVLIRGVTQHRPKETYSFRTIDGFLLNEDGVVVGGLVDNPPDDLEYPPKGAYECRVTRYAPGID